jgi:hypothetical protein
MSSTPITPNMPAPAAPAIDVNTPLDQLQQQPRNPDGTFAAVAPAEPPPAPTPADPTPDNPVIVSDLGNGRFQARYLTGEKFEGTAQEVLAKTGQAHVNTKQWAQAKVAEAQQQLEAPAAPPAAPSLFANPEEEQVANYTANLVARKLGYPDADTMVRALGHIQDSTIDYSSQLTAVQFQAQAPDFNPTAENNAKLFGVIQQSGVSDEYFGKLTRDQQVSMMRQAHAFCIQSGAYQPKPGPSSIPRMAVPPPPPPVSGSQPALVSGQIPADLMAQPGDSLEVIKQKWEKAAALGLVPGPGQSR